MDDLKYFLGGGCGIREKYQLYCPACGGTRSIEALLELRIIDSIYYNPIVLLLLVDILLMAGTSLYEKMSKTPGRFVLLRLFSNVITLVVWLGYAALRNYMLLVHGVDLLGDFI